MSESKIQWTDCSKYTVIIEPYEGEYRCYCLEIPKLSCFGLGGNRRQALTDFTNNLYDFYQTCKSENIELPKPKTEQTDLDRFVELYKSFGVECKVNWDEEKQHDEIELIHDYHKIEDYQTTSDKFDGWFGFYTKIIFDKDGKFKSQGFWE